MTLPLPPIPRGVLHRCCSLLRCQCGLPCGLIDTRAPSSCCCGVAWAAYYPRIILRVSGIITRIISSGSRTPSTTQPRSCASCGRRRASWGRRGGTPTPARADPWRPSRPASAPTRPTRATAASLQDMTMERRRHGRRASSPRRQRRIVLCCTILEHYPRLLLDAAAGGGPRAAAKGRSGTGSGGGTGSCQSPLPGCCRPLSSAMTEEGGRSRPGSCRRRPTSTPSRRRRLGGGCGRRRRASSRVRSPACPARTTPHTVSRPPPASPACTSRAAGATLPTAGLDARRSTSARGTAEGT